MPLFKRGLILILSLTLIFTGLPHGTGGSAIEDEPSVITRTYDPQALRLVVETTPGMDLEALASESGGELVRTGPLNYATLEFNMESVPEGQWVHSCAKEKSSDQVCPLDPDNMCPLTARILAYPGVLSAEWSRTFTVDSDITTQETPDFTTSNEFSVMTTDTEYYMQWYLRTIRADKVWETGVTGNGVVIAVVDTGIDLTNPEFNDPVTGKNNIAQGYNAITRSTDPEGVQDDNGHGTSMAGVIASIKDNESIVGIAHEAKIMPIKAMNKDGEGEDSIIADGIVWAVDNGAKIINLSIGSQDQSKILTDALKYAADKGVLLVGASGNIKKEDETQSNQNQETIINEVSYPGADPNVIAVSAVDRFDSITDFSHTGPEVQLSAPGNLILTTLWPREGSGLGRSTGTSIAAPMVSASAALLWSAYPDLTADDIQQALFSSAHDQGLMGQDDQYGFGRLDVYRALQFLNAKQAQQSYLSPASLGWEGGKVYTGGTSEQPDAVLSIKPGTFNIQTDSSGNDRKISFSISGITPPADFPEVITPATDAYVINPWGEELSFKPLTLTLRLTPPEAELQTEETSLQSPEQTVDPIPMKISYLYKWSTDRWIRVGGGVSQESPSMQVTIYDSGIYRAGWSPEPAYDRISGTDRIHTAIEIAKEAFPTGADTVIVARADSYPDALAGAPLAYRMQAPIILTFPHLLSLEAYEAIVQLSPENIIILGGIEAVSETVEYQLSNLGYVSRIAGTNRYATAAAIADTIGNRGEAVVVNSANFPDAIAAAAHAANQGKPILLTHTNALVHETEEVLRRLSVTDTQVIGGTGVISLGVYNRLIHPVRISGADRFATSAEVIKANPTAGSVLCVATGLNFPDALTGGVLATTNSSNILLIPKAGPTPIQTEFLQTLSGIKILALGGEGAVSTEVLEAIKSLVGEK